MKENPLYDFFMKHAFLSSVLIFLLSVHCTAEIFELPLGTSGNRAFISISDDTSLTDPITINDDMGKVDLTPRLFYYFDIGRVETAQSIEDQPDFKPTRGNSSWGHVDAACWFKFDFVSDVSAPLDLNLEILITGFPFTIRPGQRGTIYFRLDYPAGILSNAFLYSSVRYKEHAERRIGLNAIVLGINIAMIIYNSFLFFWTKKREFLYFITYMFCFSFHIYLREDYIYTLFPYLHDYYFGLPAIAFAILFAMEFLKTKKDTPLLHKALQLTFILSLFYSVMAIFFRSRFILVQRTQAYFQLFVIFMAVLASIVMISKRRWIAIFYLVSWLPLIASNFILQFEQLGLLQTNTPFTLFIVREGLYVSGAIQALLLSITLANQINLFRKEAEAEKNEKIRYKELEIFKTKFVMNVSHELRTPLTIINGTTENIILGKYGNKLDHAAPIFRVLRRNGSKMLIQINNLLNINKIENKKYNLNLQCVNIVSFVQTLVAEFESLANKKSIRLDVVVDIPRSTNVSTDNEILEMVLVNLLSNALKFTPERGAVTITLSSVNEEIEVRVSDNGPGIDESELERIFDRLYQGGEIKTQKHEGAGIGLALVRESLDLMGSAIRAENRKQGGMDFTFLLPRSLETNAIENSVNQSEIDLLRNSLEPGLIKGEESLHCKFPDILVVEDNKDLQEYINSELQDEYTVHITSNGKQALEYLSSAERPPRLILSDIMMPEMNGIDLFNVLKEKDQSRYIPFLFLSARILDEEKIALLRNGAMDFINKPFSAKELKAKINSIIQQNSELKSHYKTVIKSRIVDILENEDDGLGNQKNGNHYSIEQFSTRHNLTKREREVLLHIVQGLRDREIAEELNIAVSTVSNITSRIYKKANLAGRVDLIQSLRYS